MGMPIRSGHVRRALWFAMGALTCFALLLAGTAGRRLYQERRVLGSGPRALDGFAATYVGSAGGFDVTEVGAQGANHGYEKTVYLYRDGARVLSLNLDAHGRAEGYWAQLGPVAMRYRSGASQVAGDCEVTFALSTCVVHYRDRDLDGVFDDRWVAPLSSRVPDDVRTAEIWLDGRWVQANAAPFSATRTVEGVNGMNGTVAFRDGRWIRDAEAAGSTRGAGAGTGAPTATAPGSDEGGKGVDRKRG